MYENVSDCFRIFYVRYVVQHNLVYGEYFFKHIGVENGEFVFQELNDF
jgi:hypothetical protein